jgi:hypothetical protein
MSSLSALEPDRSPACLSDFAFDRWLAGLCPSDEAAAAAQHVASCARCSARHAELVEEKRGWQQARPPVRRLPRTPLALASGLALAAAALLALRLTPGAPAPDMTRSKGARAIGFYVKHAQSVRRGGTGELVAPGDALRFFYTSDRPAFIAVLSIDGAGQGSVYYPSAAPARAVAVAAGRELPLPASTVLDGVLGRETLVGLFCDAPIELEPVLQALTRDPAAPAPLGCSLDRLAIEKREDAP